jgi:hypothetical protein
MVDNRAKNAFPTIYLADNKWLILPYDYDSAIGINNEGELKFGYELEDIDTINGKSVFNGQDSVLYVNIRLAFADEIAKMYHDLRTGDVFAYDEIEKRFEEHQNVWGEAIFNEDAKFKYIDPLINDNDITYLPMLQGSKAEQRKWWLYNRFRYLDSKYNAGDSLEDFILLRSYAVADIEVTPYADIYATVSFDGAIVQKRALRGNSYVLENPLTGGKDAVISIYSASQLSNLGDISGLKVGMADFSQGKKLSNLKVGSNEQGYDNPNLTSLTIGNLVLLRTLDVRNCSALTQAVDISGCTNIENVYFDGTAITGLTLPNGGSLKKLHLPETITNLTILNQKHLSEFVIAGTSNITTLRIENTPIIDTLSILNTVPANSRVRLIGVDWSISTASEILALMDKLDTFRGLDENGNNLDKAVVSGTIHIHSLTGEELSEMNERYPNITIEYDSLVVKVKFYNGDNLVIEQSLETGSTITLPETPTKESTAQFNYTFKGWSLDGVNVVEVGKVGTENLTYYAVFDEVLRYYIVRFLNSDGTVLQTGTVAYGVVPTYEQATPVDPSGDEGEFIGWTPTISEVTSDVTYTAQFKGSPKLAYELNYDGTGYVVAGIGTIEDGDLIIPTTYRGLPVKEIKTSAFSHCEILTNVIVPDSVTKIQSFAFEYCKNLTDIQIGKNVSYMGNAGFQMCFKLKNVTIRTTTPPTLDGSTLFQYNDDNLVIYVPANSVEAYKSATNWSNYADKIQAIKELAFSLDAAAQTYKVTGIGTYTAGDDIIIPSTYKGLPVTAIDNNAFYNKSAVAGAVTISEGIQKIGVYAFNHSDVTELTILAKNFTMGTHAFYQCYNLTKATINGGQVGDYAFRECEVLNDVTIGEGVTYIGTSAFTRDTKITTIEIPDSVTSTGSEMFYGCSGLKTLKIGSGITLIPAYMCMGCTQLAIVDFRSATTVPTLTDTTTVFKNTPNTLKFVVPDSLYNTWINATNWSTYTNQIIKASEYTEA